MSTVRKSIQPTYDSRETGPRYHVTYRLNGRTITFQQRISSPFFKATIKISWLDRLRSLFRKNFSVTLLSDGDEDVVEDVLELDANHPGIDGSTRRQEHLSDRIVDAADQIAEHQRALTPEQRADEAAEFELEKAAMLAGAETFDPDHPFHQRAEEATGG